MNRRSFIKSMLAAAVAPMALKGAGRAWKRTEELWIPNPDYVNAPIEMSWIWSPELEKVNGVFRLKEQPLPEGHLKDPYPLRFNTADMQNPIPPLILNPRRT